MLATSAFSRGLATRSETVETQNETASETIFGLISISEAFYNTRVKVGGFPHKTAIRYDGHHHHSDYTDRVVIRI